MTVSQNKPVRKSAKQAVAQAVKVSSDPLRVGVKEFRDKATQLLAQDKPFVVERHGKVIGYYTPLPKKDPLKAREAVGKLDATLERIAAQRGLSVEQLEALMFPENATHGG